VGNASIFALLISFKKAFLRKETECSVNGNDERALEKGEKDAKTIAEQATVPYGVAMHHLKLLLAEGIVDRRGSRPYVWALTGVGQKRLVSSG
jgi:hypothetical protein